MTSAEYNNKDSPEDVQQLITYVTEHVFDPDAIDVTRFYRQWRLAKDEDAKKSVRFVIKYHIQSEDVRNAMSRLTLEQYSTTSIKAGCPPAYVFGIHMPEIIDGDPEVYLKFQIDYGSGFIIVTIHEAERPMEHPYRRIGQ